jgi:hypothetical protein
MSDLAPLEEHSGHRASLSNPGHISFRPVRDAPALYGSVSYRDTLRVPPLFTAESAVNAVGRVNLLKSTRYARARCRIPAGTA